MNTNLDCVIERIEVFALNCTQDELAGMMGISRQGLHKALTRRGIHFRQVRTKCLESRIRDWLVVMPATTIAERLRIDVRTVRRYAHRAGVRFSHGGRRAVENGKWKQN